ncbi:MAG TPA: hypothetical protein VFE78_30370 [Gemmataceae bacterium]|nr:hypothetical protein [Gemmataceae bacterium]
MAKPSHSKRTSGVLPGFSHVMVHHPNHNNQDDHHSLVGKRPRLPRGGESGSR